jgi:3,5-epimerase/4-reductase
MKKTLVVGNGYIGTRLGAEFDAAVAGDRIGSFADCQRIVAKYKPAVLINAIGYTGARNVDDCELDKDNTLLANTFVPVMLAEACLRTNVRFVHISSGCIFKYEYGKQRPIDETLIPDYYDLFYSRSKIYAERCLDYLDRRYPFLTVRIRIPLDNRPSGKNILDKLLTYKKVIDIPNSVTYIPDFILALKHLIRVKATGIYNVVNKGGLRYPELMKAYQKRVPGYSFSILPMTSFTLKRTNLVLSTKKLEQSGFKVRRIQDVLDECVREYCSHNPSKRK